MKTEQRLVHLQQQMPTVDHVCRITSFNSEAERITGVSRREAVGKKFATSRISRAFARS